MFNIGVSSGGFGDNTNNSGSDDNPTGANNGIEITSFSVITNADLGGGDDPVDPPAEACYTLPTLDGSASIFCI